MQIKEQTKIVGIHTFRTYDMRSLEARAIEWLLGGLVKLRGLFSKQAHRLFYLWLIQRLRKFQTKQLVVYNLVTTAGRSVIAQRLANVTTYTGIINYGMLGSSATAPTNGDTQMTAEVFRKVVASASYTTNTAFIDFFYAKADTNGTYQEFGTAIDGSAGANTGQLFTHALTGGWTKANTESMTVSCQYTIN